MKRSRILENFSFQNRFNKKIKKKKEHTPCHVWATVVLVESWKGKI